MQSPLSGVGAGGFPASYAKTQAAYFASRIRSEQEKLVAGCPDYGFNEYLQTGTELGIIGLILLISWFVLCICNAIRNKQHGAAGGLLSLAIFACSSYPLQLPSFRIIMIFLGSIANRNVFRKKTYKIQNRNYSCMITNTIICILCLSFYNKQQRTKDAYLQWASVKMLYNGNLFLLTITKLLYIPIISSYMFFRFFSGKMMSAS
jgi:hypothetical protein